MKIKRLPEAEEGDYNLIINKIPSFWDLRTPWGQKLASKVKDLIIEEAQKIAVEVEE